MADDEGREQREEVPKEPVQEAPHAGEGMAEGLHWPSEADEDEDEAGPAPEEALEGAPEVAPDVPAKASTLNRVIARFIDILVTLLLARLPDYVGFLAGITYIGVADGLMGGRSIGKRVIGLRVLYSKDGRSADYRASILRNSPMGLLFMLFYIPFVGWVISCLGLCFELLLIIGSPEGRRLGDEIAATVVVDEINS